MKISFNWLKEFIDLPLNVSETAELLTDLGLEVEGISDFSSVKGGLKGVVVGEVLECGPHPNADRLQLTKVSIGSDTILQIVCGAPNVATGQKVAVATAGTVLYDTDGKAVEIRKGKIRGEVSEGMICSEIELGLGTDKDGILVLDSGLEPGLSAASVFEIENDKIFEIGLTPNRSDAMSHWGVARDLKAGLIRRGKRPKLSTPSSSSFGVDNRTLPISIQVETASLAPRYCGLTISGVKVEDSPAWIQNKLKAIGQTPVNNVVDITNYVLHELGQPLHAFDAATISGQTVHVKTLPSGTKFTTLDGIERELHQEDLMICDAEKPMCIAGVMGGLYSKVTENTTTVFLESAYFDPVSIRKTAKRHGLSTDASFRFERGVDPNIADYALRRAASLIVKTAGGQISSDLLDLYPKKIENKQVFLNFDKAEKLIGERISNEIIQEILTSLDIKIVNLTETGIGMEIPAYRNDVVREVDVIEEILRVYGYNNITTSEKLHASIATVKPGEDFSVQNKIASQLTALGFYEIMNNSLTTPQYSGLSSDLKENFNVNILNPLSRDLSVMRRSMLFSGLETIRYNSNRNNSNLRLFEFGKTYLGLPGGRKESSHLALFISGMKTESTWTAPDSPSGFFFGKGVVAAVLENLNLSYSEEETESDLFSEGIDLKLNRETLVSLGIVDKKITRALDVDEEVFYADFNWDQILKKISVKAFQVQALPKYPAVQRDFALLIDNSVSFKELKNSAFQTDKKLLKEVQLFDVYTGKNLPEGKKSYALSFTFQDERKTLTDQQIDKVMEKLRRRFESDFGAALR